MQSPQRVIGIGGLAFSAVNIIVGSGIFGLPSIAASGLGPAAALAHVVCAILVGLVRLCLAEAGSRIGGAGGLYAYATLAFGYLVSGVTGTILWFASGAAASAAVANLLVNTVATIVPELSGSIPRGLLIASTYGILAAVNIRGARYSVRLSAILAITKVAPLILLVIAGAFAVHHTNFRMAEVPSVTKLGEGAVVVFFAFTGLETALCTSGEVRNPSRTVPRAILLALTSVTVLYLGLQLTAQGVLGAELPKTDAALVVVARMVWGPWGAQLLIAATLLSVSGFLAADVLCSPRVLYALAERGQLPRGLSTVHTRYGTPAFAIGACSILCAVLAISGSFRQLVIFASSGTLALYLICTLGLLRLRASHIATDGELFRAPGGPFVPLAAAAIIVWMLSTLERNKLVAALSLLLVAGSVYARRPPGFE